ncbi:MAG: hypothetical protein STSR0008_00240 [Ignavibacterium sp.]
MDNQIQYQPGVCNIGPEEIKKRMKAGHTGAIITILLLIIFILADLPRGYRLLIAIPAMMAASGYIQASMKFCAYFGFASVFNFTKLGNQTKVEDKHLQTLDKRKAYQIITYSTLIGLIVGILSFILS